MNENVFLIVPYGREIRIQYIKLHNVRNTYLRNLGDLI